MSRANEFGGSRTHETYGLVGRWHTYRCRRCGEKFRRFLAQPLEVEERFCCLACEESREKKGV